MLMSHVFSLQPIGLCGHSLLHAQSGVRSSIGPLHDLRTFLPLPGSCKLQQLLAPIAAEAFVWTRFSSSFEGMMSEKQLCALKAFLAAVALAWLTYSSWLKRPNHGSQLRE